MGELPASLQRQLTGTAKGSSHGKAFCPSAEGNLASDEECTCPLLSHCAGSLGGSLAFSVLTEGSRNGHPSPPPAEPQVPQPLPSSCLLQWDIWPLCVTARPAGQRGNLCCAPASPGGLSKGGGGLLNLWAASTAQPVSAHTPEPVPHTQALLRTFSKQTSV